MNYIRHRLLLIIFFLGKLGTLGHAKDCMRLLHSIRRHMQYFFHIQLGGH